jgi:predicted DNA-binding transcriptional regulator YafY
MAKADHMLAILMLLRTRRKMTAQQLAEELEIHIRTVYRYIDALCMSGVPIVSETGRDGGYFIPDHVKLDPLYFDAAEQKALLHAAKFIRESGYPQEEALERAIGKIKRYTSYAQAERLGQLEAGLEVIHPPANVRISGELRLLEQAIEAQCSLDIVYDAGYENTSTSRTLDPYGIVHWKDKWYAVGYCRLRGAVRCFRVDRIRSMTLTGNTFDKPGTFSARNALLESLQGHTGDSEEGLVTVRVQGGPQALNDLCGHWMFGHSLTEREKELAVFKMEEAYLYTHAPYYLLSFGGSIRVLEPEPLRACLADIAAKLVKYYKS